MLWEPLRGLTTMDSQHSSFRECKITLTCSTWLGQVYRYWNKRTWEAVSKPCCKMGLPTYWILLQKKVSKGRNFFCTKLLKTSSGELYHQMSLMRVLTEALVASLSLYTTASTSYRILLEMSRAYPFKHLLNQHALTTVAGIAYIHGKSILEVVHDE